MANYNDLKTGIDAVIKTNGRQEISGAALNTQLKNMIAELGAGYQYMGVATPATNPGTPDANVFYLASEAGTYTNFGGIVINEGEVCALVWNGTWTKQVTGAATADKLNQLGQEVDEYIGQPKVFSAAELRPRFYYNFISGRKYTVINLSDHIFSCALYTSDGTTVLQLVASNLAVNIPLSFTAEQDASIIGGYDDSMNYSIRIIPEEGLQPDMETAKGNISDILSKLPNLQTHYPRLVDADLSFISGKYIHLAGTLQTDADYQVSAPIFVQKGGVVTVKTEKQSRNFIVIAETDESGTSYTALVTTETLTPVEDVVTAQYILTANKYIAICGITNGMESLINQSGEYALKDEVEELRKTKMDFDPIFTDFSYNPGYIHANASVGIRHETPTDTLEYSTPVKVWKGCKVSVSTHANNKNFTVIAQYNPNTNSYSSLGILSSDSTTIYEYVATGDMYVVVCGTIGDISARIEMYSPYYASKSEVNGLSYYEDYITGKIETINKLNAWDGLHGDSFVFITDTHVEDNPLSCEYLIRRILEETTVKKVIHGGDSCSVTATGMRYLGWDLIYHNFNLFNRAVYGASKDGVFLNVLGNHDFNNRIYPDFGDPYFDGIDLDSRKNYLLSSSDRGIIIGDDNGVGCYYYYDDKVSKIRYIVLDAFYNQKTGTPSLGDAQFDWVVDTLENLPYGYDAIVITHISSEPVTCPTDEYAPFSRVLSILKAINNNTIVTISGVTYDFSNFDHRVIINLSGHNHADLETYVDNVLDIVTINNGYGRYRVSYNMFESGALTKVAGTVTEQAFDVFNINPEMVNVVRIGAGGDRYFHRKKYILNGTLDLGAEVKHITPTSWMSCNAAEINRQSDGEGGYVWVYPNTIVDVNASGIVTLHTGGTTGDALVVALDDDLNKEFFYIRVE